MVEYKMIIDLLDEKIPWANIKVADGYILVGMYEDDKVARELFLIDRDKAKQLAKILEAFSQEHI